MNETLARDFVVGTRGSQLALRQTELVLRPLRNAYPEVHFAVRTIRTVADRHPDHPLRQLPDVGFFVKELELALLAAEIDAVVHSMKDLPSAPTPGLTIAAVAEREDARDVIVSREHLTLEALPLGARLGTSSPRRAAFLRAYRRDLEIVPIRGNVETRIQKVDAGDVDAVCLAGAGLCRLGLESRITQWLPVDILPPAPAQGALGLQVRTLDRRAAHIAAAADHAPTRHAVAAERAVLTRLAGGCHLPVAAFARIEGTQVSLEAAIAAPDGRRIETAAGKGLITDAEGLGRSLAEDLLGRASDLILEAQER